MNRHLITAALPYANGPLHIGHIAGAYLSADIYARYMRQKGEEVLFICGSDEHGTSIEILAKKLQKMPQEVVDQYHAVLRDTFENIGMSFDHYGRTSGKKHHTMAQEFFKKLHNDGQFEARESEQYYDETAQMFLADRYIRGECPHCGYADAYGDQCEKCGTSLSADELINPRSALSDSAPVKRKTTHWYLDLSAYQSWLEGWLAEDDKQKTWKKHVLGQCKSWLKEGLHPRSMTRDLSWGIPVPLPEADGKVLYVWFDAPIGYISATAEVVDDWQNWWQNPDTKLTHFIGKDNIVFHCIIFPSMLKAHGDYILPVNVPANEFLNLEGKKLSTSRNHAVWGHEYLADFSDENGNTEIAADMLRYCLTATMPEQKDNNFTWAEFQSRVNSELVANIGNFIHRTLSLVHKYYAGDMPEDMILETKVMTDIQKTKQGVEQFIEAHEYRKALNELMEMSRIGNQYLTETEPWKLGEELAGSKLMILGTCLKIVQEIQWSMQPFMPYAAERLKNLLKNMDQKPTPLFRKVEDEEILAQQEGLQK